MRSVSLIALCAEWNRLTDPSVFLTDTEHEERRHAARKVLDTMRREGMVKGRDYRELESGKLRPII